MKVAVIPARSGSKRILKKNTRDFLGLPIIARVIKIAQQSKLFDRILVSTEDLDTAKIAQTFNAEVPFTRPTTLADDYSTTGDVLAHAVKWMETQNWKPDAVCCVYPTAVMMQIDGLIRGLDALESGSFDYAFSVTRASTSYFRSFKIIEDGGVEMLFPEWFHSRSQDLPVAYQDAGQFYWAPPKVWAEERVIFSHKACPILVPHWSAHDIDTEEDWERAEMFFKNQRICDRSKSI